jgi:hypothetical protein
MEVLGLYGASLYCSCTTHELRNIYILILSCNWVFLYSIKETINDMSKCSFLILNYLVTSVQFWFAHACSTFMFHRVDVFVVLCLYITLLAQVIAVDMNFPRSRKYIFMWGDAVPVSRTVQAPKLELLMNCSCGKTIFLFLYLLLELLISIYFSYISNHCNRVD